MARRQIPTSRSRQRNQSLLLRRRIEMAEPCWQPPTPRGNTAPPLAHDLQRVLRRNHTTMLGYMALADRPLVEAYRSMDKEAMAESSSMQQLHGSCHSISDHHQAAPIYSRLRQELALTTARLRSSLRPWLPAGQRLRVRTTPAKDTFHMHCRHLTVR